MKFVSQGEDKKKIKKIGDKNLIPDISIHSIGNLLYFITKQKPIQEY